MDDAIRRSFLEVQYTEGMALASESDILNLTPVGDSSTPPSHYIAEYACRGVMRGRDGSVAPAFSHFHVGIAFPAGYLRSVNPLRVATWLGPTNVHHPNIRTPAVCLGHILPGTALVDLLYQLYEIITYTKWAAHDFLDPAASVWARNHQDLFPVDSRPLKRRTWTFEVGPQQQGGQPS